MKNTTRDNNFSVVSGACVLVSVRDWLFEQHVGSMCTTRTALAVGTESTRHASNWSVVYDAYLTRRLPSAHDSLFERHIASTYATQTAIAVDTKYTTHANNFSVLSGKHGFPSVRHWLLGLHIASTCTTRTVIAVGTERTGHANNWSVVHDAYSTRRLPSARD